MIIIIFGEKKIKELIKIVTEEMALQLYKHERRFHKND